MPRPIRLILVLTLVHFAMTVLAIVLYFGRSLDHFDDGSLPSPADHAVGMLQDFLVFPLASLAMRWPEVFPGLVGYLPIFANSLLWAVILTLLGQSMRKPDRGSSD